MDANVVLEKAYCAVCGNDDQDKLSIKYDKGDFAVVECATCDFLFVPPHFREVISYDNYKDESVRQQVQKGNNWLKVQRHLLRMKLIQRFKKTGSLFDLGAGWGHFMVAAKQVGFEVYGIEVSKENFYYAKNELNLPVDEMDFFDMPEDRKFDVITLWDVLEHIDAADDVLEKSNRLLNDDGYIFIQVPQVDSLFSKIYKDKWGMMTLDHVNYFSRKTITHLLERKGYEVKKIKSSLELKNVLVYYILPKLKRKKKVTEDKPAVSTAERQEYFNKVTKRPMWMLKTAVFLHNIVYNMLSFFQIGEEMVVVARKVKDM